MRILVVEDDKPVATFLRKGLAADQHAVDMTGDGQEGASLAEQFDYDLVILDLNLPRMDGLEVLKRIRAQKASVPIMILTARSVVEDRVRGLDLGADDYVTKPFSFIELSARVRALLRRGRGPAVATLRAGELEMSRLDRTVKRGERRIELTPREFALLEYLLQNAGRCVTRAMIIEHVWSFSFDTMTNIVDVYISYLRKKIDQPGDRKLLHAVRGVGYQLGDNEAEQDACPPEPQKRPVASHSIPTENFRRKIQKRA